MDGGCRLDGQLGRGHGLWPFLSLQVHLRLDALNIRQDIPRVRLARQGDCLVQELLGALHIVLQQADLGNAQKCIGHVVDHAHRLGLFQAGHEMALRGVKIPLKTAQETEVVVNQGHPFHIAQCLAYGEAALEVAAGLIPVACGGGQDAQVAQRGGHVPRIAQFLADVHGLGGVGDGGAVVAHAVSNAAGEVLDCGQHTPILGLLGVVPGQGCGLQGPFQLAATEVHVGEAVQDTRRLALACFVLGLLQDHQSLPEVIVGGFRLAEIEVRHAQPAMQAGLLIWAELRFRDKFEIRLQKLFGFPDAPRAQMHIRQPHHRAPAHGRGGHGFRICNEGLGLGQEGQGLLIGVAGGRLLTCSEKVGQGLFGCPGAHKVESQFFRVLLLLALPARGEGVRHLQMKGLPTNFEQTFVHNFLDQMMADAPCTGERPPVLSRRGWRFTWAVHGRVHRDEQVAPRKFLERLLHLLDMGG